jgi:hypothetical protein
MVDLKESEESKMTWNFLPTEEQETAATLIQLQDDRVVRIEVDSSYTPSTCDTCDYGKAYIQNLILTFEKNGVAKYEFKDSEDYVFNESRMIFFLTNNIDQFKEMSFKEFNQMLKDLSKPKYFGYQGNEILDKLKGDL